MAQTVTFSQHEFALPPRATVSLMETSLDHQQLMTTSSSASPFVKEEEDQEENDERGGTKKRKSWGQELPVPKTNLPPRKRAKTDDEKEQRRIERVLRNRAAAQSSRERKRQEVEKLEGEKSTIEQQNQYLKDRLMAAEHEKFKLSQQLAKAKAELKVLRPDSSASPPMSPSSATISTSALLSSPAGQAECFDSDKLKQEIDDYSAVNFYPTPQTFASNTAGSARSSPSAMTLSPSQSPCAPSLTYDESLLASPDMTQHPAEVLCDLQCQSAGASKDSDQESRASQSTAIPSSLAILPLSDQQACHKQQLILRSMIWTFMVYSHLLTILPLPPISPLARSAWATPP